MRYLIFVGLLFLMSFKSWSLVSVGGYVPFGLSTQKETTGGRNTFSLEPMVSVNTVFATPFYGQLFMPEFAMVFHGSGQEDYSKTTMLFLFDFGHRFSPTFVLRYGLGTAITRISADGGEVTLNNGDELDTFYKPNESRSSWNTTLNLGIEKAIMSQYALRFQTYWFSMFNGDARDVSYSFNVVYYL